MPQKVSEKLLWEIHSLSHWAPWDGGFILVFPRLCYSVAVHWEGPKPLSVLGTSCIGMLPES